MELLCPDPAVTFACFLICLHSGLGYPMVTMSNFAGPQANGLLTTFPGDRLEWYLQNLPACTLTRCVLFQEVLPKSRFVQFNPSLIRLSVLLAKYASKTSG